MNIKQDNKLELFPVPVDYKLVLPFFWTVEQENAAMCYIGTHFSTKLFTAKINVYV
jgi:hypothetical protein